MCLLERNARTLWSTNLSICQSVNLLVCCGAACNRKSFVAPNCKIFSIFCVRFWIRNEQTSSYHRVPPPLPHSPLCPHLTLSRHGKWMANISSYFFGCMHFWPQASGLLQLSFFSASAAASVLLFFFPLLKQFFQLSLCNREGERERETDGKSTWLSQSPKVADKVLEKVINLCTERRLRMKRGPAGEWR